eukprot:gnl/TRDRNA2_/TRDRNA2_134883_c0_seq1.p1 gnl/TRDRNA2_/TRDRNA2_134883_c0~~gnl/TRDRNA2_/TRDRNA2_134883_c0_seq1.p1  ORF type:complete len:319 (+),score=56.10 gnl/TRDRNA2_/TRDRNA2_134883_c0_seq1:135-959(+)
MGVFDGTVGDFASENVQSIIVPKLLESNNWKSFRKSDKDSAKVVPVRSDQEKLLEKAMYDMYKTCDAELLDRCGENLQHYATCTSVTILVVKNLIVVGHLGDSRIILGKESEAGGHELVGEQLTNDHKPDLAPERERIEKSGGLVVRLQNHNNKPFIRGGDFTMRTALGERPMQLQYSRAFGGKDLKIFGLSNVPDVRIVRMGTPGYRRVRWLILASDGLWDVLTAQQAVAEAQEAVQTHKNPAEALVNKVLKVQRDRGARADNITAICLQFPE